ncbi:TIGR03086 family metal-binding protein [Actinoplanes aureus]|uniref:TIGR03086 family protein n=1 Tax=Actinoplanes aureus TaxID=2792083 RepID=A0A931G2H4_9ACTN|nr:TIGR03086 family metal-binding protein [Actinoplanes aureus]MBG0567717.1 TIGR03086 family protein [Actinoplanes aureus]
MADRVPLDFDPPVRQIRALLLGVDDDDLAAPTPCPDWSVAALLDHLMGLAFAFSQAARKRTDAPGTSGPPPEPSADHLSPHWRSRLPVLLEDLSTAWRDPAAWTGTAQAGGVTLPATAMGTVAVNELVIHGWDLARATGQDYAADPRALEVLVEFLAQGPAEGTPGMFGPVVPVDPENDLLSQAVALAGRDPSWRPPRSRDAAAARPHRTSP